MRCIYCLFGVHDEGHGMVTEKFTRQTSTFNYTIFAAGSNDQLGFTYFQTTCAPLSDAVYIDTHG